MRPLDTEPGALISILKTSFDPSYTAIIFVMRSNAIFAWFLTGSESFTGVFQYGGVETIFYREDFPESFEAKKTNCEYFGGKIPSSKSWFWRIFFTFKDLNEFLFELKYNRRFRNLKFTIIEISFIGNSL